MNTDKRLTQTLHVRCTALSRYLSLRGFTAVHFSPKPVWQDGGKENVSNTTYDTLTPNDRNLSSSLFVVCTCQCIHRKALTSQIALTSQCSLSPLPHSPLRLGWASLLAAFRFRVSGSSISEKEIQSSDMNDRK